MDENYTLVFAIPRKRDVRKYKSQSQYVYQNVLSRPDLTYFEAQEAVFELQRIQQKMRMFWFYDGIVKLTG